MGKVPKFKTANIFFCAASFFRFWENTIPECVMLHAHQHLQAHRLVHHLTPDYNNIVTVFHYTISLKLKLITGYRLYLIVGLDCGLDCWTLFISHDLHPIKSCKFGCSKHTSSSHCMLENVNECTMHKLHGRMCMVNSW